MKKLALGALLVGVLAACGGGKKVVVVDSSGDSASGVCNPLTQMGCQPMEKCTWIVDATDPMYVGHIGCEPAGSAAIDAACTYGAAGATGYDNCVAGAVCSAFSQKTLGMTGKCKQICNNQGGDPMCDANHVCVTYSVLFTTGSTSPHAAGVCDHICDPFDDNDFDGSGSGVGLGSGNPRPGHTCDTGSNDFLRGCYGHPSRGAMPPTGWSCAGDGGYGSGSGSGSAEVFPDLGFRHRTACTTADGCAGPNETTYTNSCNQGYIPLFYDHTGVTTVDCIALCKPLNCYAGNCGTNNANRLGAFPHRCTPPDAVGTFNTTANHEECRYEWTLEINGSGDYLPSPTSNTVGFCFDHSKYQYDSNGDGQITGSDASLPGCEQVQLVGSGSDPSMPTSYWGASYVSMGCVDTSTAGIGSGSGSAVGKSGLIQTHGLDKNVLIDGPRTLYHREMRAD